MRAVAIWATLAFAAPAWGSHGAIPFSDDDKARTGLLAGTALLLAFTDAAPEESAYWRAQFPVDRLAASLLEAGTRESVYRARMISDWGLAAVVAAPMLAPGPVEGEGRWQAAQSYAVTGIFVQTIKNLVGRERPYVEQCRENKLAQDCFSSFRNGSFVSGHTAFAFTGAGLLCAFRADGACQAGLAAAVGVGLLRVVSRQHHFSDVVIGGLAGWSSGYYLAKWRVPDHARAGAARAALGFQLNVPVSF